MPEDRERAAGDWGSDAQPEESVGADRQCIGRDDTHGRIIMRKQRIRRLEALVERLDTAEKPPPRRLQTAQDVIDLLQEQVEALRAERWAGAVQKARAIGYLAGIARKAIETGTLAARLAMLEAVLRQRKESEQR